MNIYQVDDENWYMANSLEDAIAAASSYTGCPIDDYASARELSEDEMDSLIYFDNEENNDRGEPIDRELSFREALAEHMAEDPSTPRLFATTDY